MVALLPAFNEAGGIGAAIEALLTQTRPVDLVVVIPNGCSDDTAAIAQRYAAAHDQVVVFELPRLENKKAEALNRAWAEYARDGDVVIAQDADSRLAPDAFERWEAEFLADQARTHRERRHGALAGSSAKFSMPGKGMLASLQRSEFSNAVDRSLLRGWTPVSTGAGTAYDGAALRALVGELGTEGPWPYGTPTEDYRLTLLLRERGFKTVVSPTVRAETDPMRSVRALWGQRRKWGTGIIQDLSSAGLRGYTAYDWAQQFRLWIGVIIRLMAVTSIVGQILIREVLFDWRFWAIPIALETAKRMFFASRIHGRTRKDILLAASIAPSELYGWLLTASSVNAYRIASLKKVTGRETDLWTRQYLAEGHAAAAVHVDTPDSSIDVDVRVGKSHVDIRVRVTRRLRGWLVRCLAALIALAAIRLAAEMLTSVNIKDWLDFGTVTFFTALVLYNVADFVTISRLLVRWKDHQRP